MEEKRKNNGSKSGKVRIIMEKRGRRVVEKLMKKSQIDAVLEVPGDKSISHRSIMIGALAKGITEIEGFSLSEDCRSTILCFEKMGIDIDIATGTNIKVDGKGLYGLKEPVDMLNVGNSGTTMRLISGILAGQHFTSRVTGDNSIQKRPMGRIITPLSQMGANIAGEAGGFAPLTIAGGNLSGIEYHMPVASAQVKSAILLAGLYSEGETTLVQPNITRDHTEIMLENFGADISREGLRVTLKSARNLEGTKVNIPGDISSAAYFIALGILSEKSRITIKNVGVNPTRSGLVEVLKQMGASIEISNIRSFSGERVADIYVKSSELKGIEISGSMIPLMIDEIPVLAVCALFAKGTTVIKDAGELKVKESDRIHAMVIELQKFGAAIRETDDGMIIEGEKALSGAHVDSHGDHRIAMSLGICASLISGETYIHGAQCCDISYPDFFKQLYLL